LNTPSGTSLSEILDFPVHNILSSIEFALNRAEYIARLSGWTEVTPSIDKSTMSQRDRLDRITNTCKSLAIAKGFSILRSKWREFLNWLTERSRGNADLTEEMVLGTIEDTIRSLSGNGDETGGLRYLKRVEQEAYSDADWYQWRTMKIIEHIMREEKNAKPAVLPGTGPPSFPTDEE
jgi:hypothetical protein